MNTTGSFITTTDSGSPAEWQWQDFVVAYTTNKLTLCQAALGIVNWYNNQSKYIVPNTIPFKVVLECLGHKLTKNELIEIELGYEGSLENWYHAGHKPVGWYQLFEDNYYQYLEE